MFTANNGGKEFYQVTAHRLLLQRCNNGASRQEALKCTTNVAHCVSNECREAFNGMLTCLISQGPLTGDKFPAICMRYDAALNTCIDAHSAKYGASAPSISEDETLRKLQDRIAAGQFPQEKLDAYAAEVLSSRTASEYGPDFAKNLGFIKSSAENKYDWEAAEIRRDEESRGSADLFELAGVKSEKQQQKKPVEINQLSAPFLRVDKQTLKKLIEQKN